MGKSPGESSSNKIMNLGRFHMSEVTGQTILIATMISLLIKTIQPDHSNSK